MSMYDYLIIGSGLYGSIFAFEAAKKGKKVLVIEKREHMGGNVFTEEVAGIHIHRYGAHIFHTNDQRIWEYINQFATFNRFTNAPLALYKGKLFNLPFNMNTFHQLWGVTSPQEAKDIISKQRLAFEVSQPKNLEEQAISLVGTDIYETLIKGYTEKQWGRPCHELPAFIIKRLPVRFTFDNNYFNDLYQGIPIGGYTQIIKKMLTHPNIELRLSTDYFNNRKNFNQLAKDIIYTGMIDEFYDYEYGHLEYRSLRFEDEIIQQENYQGNAVINYTEKGVPYTRSIEHKHFDFGTQPSTVVTKEFPQEWKPGMEAYYPINDQKNSTVFKKYLEKAKKERNVYFGGRLGTYKYYDMHQVVAAALRDFEKVNAN